jgi:5'-methylthioadenosine phosphorylase
MIRVAIIGGKGQESPDYLQNVREITSDTPFGKAGPAMYTGQFDGLDVIHLPRHNMDRSIPPSKINYRANFYALKQLGCSYIFATSTCGSLREEICPGDVIILDQFIDMTKQLITGIHEELKNGAEHYVNQPEPFSEDLRNHLIESAIVQGITVHTKGIVISIDGQRCSSRAESNLYRNWGADVINMTTAPEVILANELEIPYAALCLCTKYDSWRMADNNKDVTTSEIISAHSDKVSRLLAYALRKIDE